MLCTMFIFMFMSALLFFFCFFNLCFPFCVRASVSLFLAFYYLCIVRIIAFRGRKRQNEPLESENSIEKVFHELETHSPEYFRLAPTCYNKDCCKTNSSRTNASKNAIPKIEKAKHDKCKPIAMQSKHIPFLSPCVWMEQRSMLLLQLVLSHAHYMLCMFVCARARVCVCRVTFYQPKQLGKCL